MAKGKPSLAGLCTVVPDHVNKKQSWFDKKNPAEQATLLEIQADWHAGKFCLPGQTMDWIYLKVSEVITLNTSASSFKVWLRGEK